MIKIQKVKFKNLFSFGNVPTVIDIENAQKTIITGINGHGKSTLITAICFGLFGKAFRDIKKGGLINNINKSDLLVEIDFSIKTNQYKVIRGISPNIFEIYTNGVLLQQEASSKDYQRILETEILNLNYKTFTQIVVLGSSNYIPFMKLPSAHRREIIEDILNISIFSKMNELLKQRLKDNEIEMNLQENKKEFTKKQYKILFEKYKCSARSKEERLRIRKNGIEETEQKIFDISEQISFNKLSLKEVQDYKSLSRSKKELEGFLHKIESNLSRAKKEIEFYENNDKCPKCNKDLDENHKDKHLKILIAAREKYLAALEELNSRILNIDNQIKAEKNKEKENTRIEQEITKLKYQLSSQKDHLVILKRDVKDIKEETNEIISYDELEALKNDVKSIDAEVKSLYTKQNIMKQGLFILKDSGAKTRIINFYLPLINKTINEYLEKFNFNILFNFDENFNESCKARNYDSFQYGNFSEGERLRIDLSLMFTWREIAKRKNSASVNLLFFDEILDSAMDVNGIENFLEIISEYEKEVSFFVISHREGVDSFFDRHIVAEKTNGFSKYTERDR